MKDKIIGIGLAVVLASGIFLSVSGAGEGASQKWVNQKILISETNTQHIVDIKLEDLRSNLRSAIERATQILANTNDTNAIATAINMMKMSATPVGNYLIDSSISIMY